MSRRRRGRTDDQLAAMIGGSAERRPEGGRSET
jgi:hypothetical protein